MDRTEKRTFRGVVKAPITERTTKPRDEGVTMVIDKGLGIHVLHDLLCLGGPYIDFLKLGFGTALLYTKELLAEKIRLAKLHDILIYPGGTLLELAFLQDRGFSFVERAAELGFTAIEVSEGTVAIERSERERLIHHGIACGLVVLTEVGKKDPSIKFDPSEAADTAEHDLDAGARFVIVEGRDSGQGVGVYQSDGKIETDRSDALIARLGTMNRIMWEAPRTDQQQEWLIRLGPNANFGNVQPGDVITLEATRQALRGDTLQAFASSRHTGNAAPSNAS